MTRLLPSLTIYHKSSATPCSPSGIQWIPNVLRSPYTDSSSISNVHYHSSVIQATTPGTKIARRLSLSSILDRPIPVLAIDRSPAHLDHPRVNDCYVLGFRFSLFLSFSLSLFLSPSPFCAH